MERRYVGVDPPLVEFVDESEPDYLPTDEGEY